MMKRLTIIFIISLITIAIHAQIIHIPGDFPTIQAGIDAASDGDTVLVDPGTYIENIDFFGKKICVASQFILSLDPDYISQTIIHPDNYDTSSVKFENGEDSTAVLAGFKIYGGSVYLGSGIFCMDASPVLRNLIITGGGPGFWGGYGGGIYLNNSYAKLKDLLITENSSTGGGGIYMEDSGPTLENVTITQNEANFGGGIAMLGSIPFFDSISRCNIFFNEAETGSDMYSSSFIEVMVDTFTVCFPGSRHASPISNFSFDILTCKLDQVEADLWVSPDGSDDNSGLSQDAPLKTISHAFSKVLADSLNRHTVHLLEGLYSPSANGEFFPVSLPKYVDLIGVSKEDVILDAGGSGSVLSIMNNSNVLITGMTLRNGDADNGAGGGGIYCKNSNPVLRDLIISGNFATYWGTGENGGGAYFSYSKPVMENILIQDNMATHGGGIAFMIGCVAKLNNVVITGNESYGGAGIESFQSTLYLDNTTIADNLEGVGISMGEYFWPTINNSIIWGNEGGQISGTAQVRYSDIMGGYQGEGNINVDPEFVGSGDHPYALSENSPCIDSGKPDTTGLGLPRWDILGNYRVWDGDNDGTNRIDMGAYEFGAEPVGVSESAVGGRRSAVSCYPNPAKDIVDFRFSIADGRWVTLKIVDVHGRVVETVVDQYLHAGEHSVQFNVSGLAPGVYFYQLSEIRNPQAEIRNKLIVR